MNELYVDADGTRYFLQLEWPRMKLSRIRRVLTILTIILTVGSILLLLGTAYTADHFVVQSVTTRRFIGLQGYTLEATLNLQNAGLFEVALNLDGSVLSGQNLVVQNSTHWTIPPASGGNYTFTLFVDNATAVTYFTALAPQPVLAFTVTAVTAYGLVSVILAGSRNINVTSG